MASLGYSYGSLIAMMGGGAVDYIAPVKVPEIKAVLTFSSRGIILGLVIPDKAFAHLSVPTMMVTGTKDLITGFVTDPLAHLLPFEKALAGGRYAIIVKDGTREFIAAKDSRFDKIWAIAVNFCRALLLGDAAAMKLLENVNLMMTWSFSPDSRCIGQLSSRSL